MFQSFFPRISWLLLGAGIVLIAPAVGHTQGQIKAKEDLSKAYEANRAHRDALLNGEESATAADKKIATAAAEWFIFRITIKTIDHSVVHKEFANKVADFVDKKNEKAKTDFRKLLGVECVTAMKEVLKRDIKAEPTTVVQAAEMLTSMGKLKTEEVSNYLCELAKNGKNPVVQLYALKALREVLPVSKAQPDPEGGDFELFFKYKGRDVKNVDALRQFIDSPISVKGMSPEEIKAVTFIRREAIISLAKAEVPAVFAVVNKKKPTPPEGVAAHTLLNVLAGNVQPPPTLQEKVEASLGLCAMRYPNMPEYEPQVAIYLIGRTVEEFISEYNKDWANFAALGAGKKVSYVAFKADARRLRAGLKELSANTLAPHTKTAKELEAASGSILDEIYLHKQLNRVVELNNFVSQTRPKTGSMFSKEASMFKTLTMPPIPLK